jgi:hypothetical protein
VTRSSSFNDLVELDGQGAELIASQLVKCIRNAGFTEEYLHQHWKYFVTDGAIVMLGNPLPIAFLLALYESPLGACCSGRDQRRGSHQSFKELFRLYLQSFQSVEQE